jgi:ABC-type uncharacterized transport system ATPase subunit
LGEQHSGNELLRHLLDNGASIRRFEEILPTFNEIFIRRVGETGG